MQGNRHFEHTRASSKCRDITAGPFGRCVMNLGYVLNQELVHKVMLSFVQLQPNPLISYLLYFRHF